MMKRAPVKAAINEQMENRFGFSPTIKILKKTILYNSTVMGWQQL